MPRTKASNAPDGKPNRHGRGTSDDASRDIKYPKAKSRNCLKISDTHSIHPKVGSDWSDNVRRLRQNRLRLPLISRADNPIRQASTTKRAVNLSIHRSCLGRDDKTRTCDLAPPRRVRYQLRYIPFLVCECKVRAFFRYLQIISYFCSNIFANYCRLWPLTGYYRLLSFRAM